MSDVIVITSGKGGVGKTTSTANIGSALAKLGKKVVVIDSDIGLRNLDVVLGLENRIVFDIVDVTTGNCDVKKALIKDRRIEGLALLPAAQTRDKTAVQPNQMKSLVEDLKKEMDYVVIDSPAGIEQGFKNAIAGADFALIVTTPEVSAVRDADRIIGLLEAEGLKDPEVIINRINAEMVSRGDMMNIEDIIEILAVQLKGIVPEDNIIIVSSNRGEPVVLKDNPKAGQAFKNIAKRITGEEVNFISLEDNSFFTKLKKIFSFS